MLDDELKALCNYVLDAQIKPETWVEVMNLGLEISNDELVARAIEVMPTHVWNDAFLFCFCCCVYLFVYFYFILNLAYYLFASFLLFCVSLSFFIAYS
jgi:hypothetical protein